MASKIKDFISFIDIEASGWPPLGYAIEIAWNDKKGNIHNFLINPYSFDDKSFEFWSPDSQKVHNISRQMLREQGVDGQWLVEYLNNELKGQTLYSDAILYDTYWIDFIYKACHYRRNWKIKGAEQVWYHVFGKHYQNEVTYWILSLEEEGIHHTHRAADDVRLLLEIYKRKRK